MSEKKTDLEWAKEGPKRSGKLDLIKYLEGKKVTQRQAIKAKCYDCNGMGEVDTCGIKECSLFPYSPYRDKSIPLGFETKKKTGYALSKRKKK